MSDPGTPLPQAGGDDITTPEPIAPGSRVEVRKRFDDSWAHGFEVLRATPEGYRLRRLSDGAELPATFALEEVRPERERRRAMWWY